MNISLEKVTKKNEKTFLNLWQFFAYDISEMNKMDLNEDGLFTLPTDIDEYTKDKRYRSFTIKVDDAIAGLAVIMFMRDEKLNYFRHYFIMRKFRHQGISKKAVNKIFSAYPGRWRVSQFDYNKQAISFWHDVINEYTHGKFTETRRMDDLGPQQDF